MPDLDLSGMNQQGKEDRGDSHDTLCHHDYLPPVNPIAQNSPQGPTSNTGSELAPPTVTTRSADADEPTVNSRTSQPTVNSWNHWALLAQKLLVHRSR